MRKIFGTDGIRGIANNYPLTPELVVKIGKAIAHVFSKKHNRKIKIVIGKDTRLSGYMIENALTSGIVSMGSDVLLVGPLPTPAIAHLTKSLNCDIGIVLTASHNPADDNGIKVFGSDGYKLYDEEEEEVERYVFSENISTDHIKGNKIGKAYRIDDARGRYIEYVKATINNNSLEGLRMVIDCANGAAYAVAPDIFSELGAEVIVLNNKPDGLNINYECGALHPEVIQQKISEVKADIGVAFDGDADRVVCCDEKGNPVDGDQILTMFALNMIKKNKLNDNALVITDYSNLAVDETIRKAGGNVIRAQNGDRYVVEEMRKQGYNFGGEKSGHLIFGDYSTTGDGIISALQVVNIMNETKKPLSELCFCFTPYPQITRNLEVREKIPFENIPQVQNIITEINSKLGNEGRTLVRYSGTEPVCRIMIEGKNLQEIENYAMQIEEAIKNSLEK